MDGNTSFCFKAGFYLNSFSLLQLHIFLVRPHLEYTSSMWDPHTKRHLNLLEGVQKFALRVSFKQYSGSYEDYYLKLKARRMFLKPCTFYKIYIMGYHILWFIDPP